MTKTFSATPPTASVHHRLPRKPVAEARVSLEVREVSAATASLLSPSPSENESPLGKVPFKDRDRDEDGSRRGSWASSSWWWWEIGACIVSIVACGSLVALLAVIDQTSRASWTASIEPNTLLALCSTLSRSAIMVPLASCLSQLKWRHFRTRAHSLDHLDIIDRSSRGPWGSLMLLLQLPRAGVVLSMLAALSVISLVVSPSVQQVLETGTRQVNMANASLSYATTYTSKALQYTTEDEFMNTDLRVASSDYYFLYSSVVSGIHDPVKPNFQCPSDSCAWPVYTTIGVCYDFQDVTETTERECQPVSPLDGRTQIRNCTYTLPYKYDMDTYKYPIDWTFTNDTMSGYGRTKSVMITQAYQESRVDGYASTTFEMLVANLTQRGYEGEHPLPPPVRSYRNVFYLCAQTFGNSSAKQQRLQQGDLSTERLYLVEDEEDSSQRRVWKTNSSDDHFILNHSQGSIFHWFLPEWLKGVSAVTSAFDSGPGDLTGAYMYNEGLEKPMANIAQTLSSLMQSSEPGDNYNATTLGGDAFVNEPYFNVRWPWIAIIVLETLCTTVLLVISIALSSRASLLKDSSFALLVHGLEGWSGVQPPATETSGTLDALAKGMIAKLEADGDGVLKFVKQD